MTAAPEIWFEDFFECQQLQFGSVTVAREEVLDFARRYDPQPFHIDEDAAAASIYGGIIASGWHTGAMMMRLLCDGLFLRAAGMGSPGLDQLRWVRPVRPGDTLTLTGKVLSAKLSRSKPDRGSVDISYRVHNQHGELAMTFQAVTLFARRDQGETADG
ncbi:MaoC family dehydratase [Emcibacter sp. SYSU 3D8]|uniref:MaoC family dehydratase n=1 Tax=Emcibacter sp. SYSU 3D8 TaxID=3133969 RepID=UPI0031FF10C1